ncbi:GAF domain-containing protein [Candidatus Parabeggiatoa sp. HSG14]|uniref:GAF domain-containing protein n=1 Tax=Candidatus Parabeggiatoa sp. HSG14 TaxID=3055593 RepID=UPI0025A6B81A|nr:cache domain-containing protein [Thiotrichales bacterium HSG14]
MMNAPSFSQDKKTSLSFFRSLRGKFILLLLSVSLIPLLIMGILVYIQAEKALGDKVSHELAAVRDIKASWIEAYFSERLSDMKILSNESSTIAAIRAFENTAISMEILDKGNDEFLKGCRSLYLNKPDLVNANDDSAYSVAHAQYHPRFKKYLETYGYYDIFLVEPYNGNILYTVMKENDFCTSLIHGLYADTPISKIFKETVKATDPDFTVLKDFAHYTASNNAASFIATPIFDHSQLVGVLIFQLSINQIDKIMQQQAGLGKTGETVLVSSDDFFLRSNSRFSEESTLFKHKRDNEASRAAAEGKTGVKTVFDADGNSTLIAYKPLNIMGVRWSLLAMIDKTEAFAIIQQMLTLTLIIMAIIAVIVISVAFLTGYFVVKPILTMTHVARQLATGDINQAIDDIKSQDEIGLMAHAFQQMTINLRQVIKDIVKISKDLANGNLCATPAAKYQGDFIQIKQALEMVLFNQRQVVEDIVQLSQGLAEGGQNVIAKAEYKGDFVQIKNALETAAAKLTEAMAKNAIQDWLKTGQTQLNEQISGEQNVMTLSKNIITFLTTYLEAQVGVFYLLEGKEGTGERDNVENTCLKLIASYAYTQRKGMGHQFKVGEGLIGQAALEKQRILVTEIPEDYINIQSGLGEAVPQQLVIIPFMYENVVKGVIEIGSFHSFTEVQLELLDQIISNIGIAVNTADSRTKMQVLLQG